MGEPADPVVAHAQQHPVTVAAALQHASPELLVERHRGGHVLDVLHRRAVLEAFQALEASGK